MSFIPFGTAWVGTYPTSVVPLAFYFADMALASMAFHLMYYLILKESGEKYRIGARSIVSLMTYTLAAVLGGFFPIAAYIVVVAVSAWWILPAIIFRKNPG